jgi:hypothetical protein
VDLDGDGIPDLLSGSWPGNLYFFKGLGKGKFAPKQTLKDKSDKPIKIESASTVFAVDWNGDGKLDLLIGDVMGRVHLLLNEGTPTHPAFGKAQELTVDGTPIRVPAGDSHPIAVDWDGDKLLDLLVGCGDGSVQFYKNIGTRMQPKLAKPRALVPASKEGFDPNATSIHPGMRAKICVVDWKGDGRLDLLVGDYCSYQAKVDIPESERPAVEAARKKQAKLMKNMQEFSQTFQEAMNGPPKKLTEAETEARKQKKDELMNKYQDLMQMPQQDVAKLAKLKRLPAPSAEQQKEIVALQNKLDTLQKKLPAILDEVLPYEIGPFDEPPEKTKERFKKLRDSYVRMMPSQFEMMLLQEITRPYDNSQLAGSVWAYRRQEERAPK